MKAQIRWSDGFAEYDGGWRSRWPDQETWCSDEDTVEEAITSLIEKYPRGFSKVEDVDYEIVRDDGKRWKIFISQTKAGGEYQAELAGQRFRVSGLTPFLALDAFLAQPEVRHYAFEPSAEVMEMRTFKLNLPAPPKPPIPEPVPATSRSARAVDL